MNDTIAAAATPALPSAISIIRLSGSESKKILLSVFKPMKGSLRPRRMVFGKLFTPDGAQVDEGLAVFMPGPGSYTGEDTAELYCHGSPGVTALVLGALFEAGARQALPGEYTRRAFLNGRMDLSQSEAVIDLIESETKAAASNAAAQLGGVLGKRLTALRDELIDMATQLSAQMDFPDEEVPELFTPELISRLKATDKTLSSLRASYSRGALIKSGVVCAITGRPNVGKSSLLNALAGFDRSIVTDIPGTTRDTVEQALTLNGQKFVFSDTAGIRDTEDAVEKLGVGRAEAAVRAADAVIAVFDASAPLSDEDRLVISSAKDKTSFCVLNKCDLPEKLDVAALTKIFKTIYRVSAADGTGLNALTSALCDAFKGSTGAGDSFITNPRQEDALRRASEAVHRAISAAALTADVLCTDIEEAAEALGEITGQTASSEIVEQIFSRFCVGK